MRLCGITSLSEARPRLVNSLDVDRLVVRDDLSDLRGHLLSKL